MQPPVINGLLGPLVEEMVRKEGSVSRLLSEDVRFRTAVKHGRRYFGPSVKIAEENFCGSKFCVQWDETFI